MNKKIWIIIGIVVAAGIVAAYFRYDSVYEKQIKSSASISDWQTYSNSSLGYSIMYPVGWKAENVTKTSDTLINISDDNQIILIQVWDYNPDQLSIDEWLKTQEWPSSEAIEKQFKPIGVVGGVDAVMQSESGTIYFTQGTKVFIVENGVTSIRKVVDEKLLLKILSTFKFTK